MMPDRHNLRITDLPDGYTLVGIEADSFVVRKPNGEGLLIQQEGHEVGITTWPSAHAGAHAPRLGADRCENPYTTPMD